MFPESSCGANSEVAGACDKQAEQGNDFSDLVSFGTEFGVVPVFAAAEEPLKKETVEKQVWGKEFEVC